MRIHLIILSFAVIFSRSLAADEENSTDNTKENIRAKSKEKIEGTVIGIDLGTTYSW